MKLEKVIVAKDSEPDYKPSIHIDTSNEMAGRCNVGDEVTIVIKGTVKSTRQSEDDWGAPGSVSVEYDRIGLDPAKSEEEYMVDDMFGDDM